MSKEKKKEETGYIEEREHYDKIRTGEDLTRDLPREQRQVVDDIRKGLTCIYHPYMVMPEEDLKFACLFF